MIDLSTIPAALLENRGSYATVRSAHEDAKKSLQMLCGQLAATATQVLRRMQPDNDDVPASVDELMAVAKNTISLMEACVVQIESLAVQRAALKPLAWPKK
jgi:hypothetical protein